MLLGLVSSRAQLQTSIKEDGIIFIGLLAPRSAQASGSVYYQNELKGKFGVPFKPTLFYVP